MNIKDTRVVLIHYVMPEYANPVGFLYGGRMMDWIATAGTLAASRVAKGIVVLGSMDDIFFINPVKVGDIVTLTAQVEYVGRSSMEVSVRVESENPETGKSRLATYAYLAFVAVDREVRPRPVKVKIVPGDENEKRIYENAKRRRVARMRRLADRRRKVMDTSDPTQGLRWRLESPRAVFPEDTFIGNIMFAGKLLMMIDEAAGILASRYARGAVVTAGIDAMDFYAPIRVGEAVRLMIGLNYVGRTSMELGVKVVAENLVTGEEKHTCTAYLTFVHIGDDGRPRPLPRYSPRSLVEKKRWAEAALRREARLERLRNLKSELSMYSRYE